MSEIGVCLRIFRIDRECLLILVYRSSRVFGLSQNYTQVVPDDGVSSGDRKRMFEQCPAILPISNLMPGSHPKQQQHQSGNSKRDPVSYTHLTLPTSDLV